MSTITPLKPHDTDALRSTLEQRQRTLRAEVQEVKSERGAAPSMMRGEVGDEGDIGEQRTRDAVRSAEELRDTTELLAIDAALRRIEEGAYGLCSVCGITIPLARLKAQPAAERCIDCQERHERTHPSTLRAAPMH
jgi:RNA polymerase-binding protein DksA